MKKLKITILILLLLIISFSVILWSKKDKAKVCFKDKCFIAEIADTEKERREGLQNRENLKSNAGMLFVFDGEEKHSFWMENTLIPLDIIWINKDKEVVFIKQNATPCSNCLSYTPDEKAKYVLEVNAGTTKDIGLKEGDKIILDKLFLW